MFHRLIIFALLIVAIMVIARKLAARNSALIPIAAEMDTPDAAKALRALEPANVIPASKKWADDLQGFAQSNPGQWIVGHCEQPCLSEAEAIKVATDDAVRAAYPKVREDLGISLTDANWLRRRIAKDIEAGQLQADSFVEKFERPYGTLWTDSILLDLSPKALDPLVQHYREEIAARRAHFGIAIVISFAVTAGAWIVCLILNVLTRGYFATRLRFAAAVVTLVAIVVSLQF